MKKINFLITSIILVLCLSSKSHSFTNNNEFLKFKKNHEFFCKKLNSPNLPNTENVWKLEKKNKFLHLFTNQIDGQILQIRTLFRSNQIQKKIFTYFKKLEIPFIEIRSDKNCNIQTIRKIIYNSKLKPQEIHSISTSKYKINSIKYLNPKLPNFDTDSKKNIIALIDTGINYTLKILQPNIAVKDKKILGFDFWDNDDKPFDSDPRQSPFYPRHHGTTVFSILAKDSPNSFIAPYRFPALNMCKFKELVEHIAKNSIRLVNLSMGSNKLKDWTCFEKAAKENKNIIFVVSAGNNSFNIDQNPIYPASLDLKNILTVTSSDQSGRLGRGSNYGEKSVDFMLPAERLEVIDHRGVKAFAGGTSYAAPRLAALISRYIENNPNCTNDEIYDFLKKRAIQKGKKLTKFGWIPDPEDNYLIN
jgi:hypothetical protein